jgi:NAD(P)-dependent dehydrogenase (short-subunit alcohol dehydrogenase family)
LFCDLTIGVTNAIITGGGGDIGASCARLLAAQGASVLVVDADRPAAERVAQRINDVQCVALAGGGVGGPTLRGRLTSSPPQFGHRPSIASAQSRQKVHS